MSIQFSTFNKVKPLQLPAIKHSSGLNSNVLAVLPHVDTFQKINPALRELTPLKFSGTKLDADGAFEINLTDAQMDLVLEKTQTIPLKKPAAYEQLSQGNKRALPHLVRVAQIMGDVYLQQLHPDNLKAKTLLEQSSAEGNRTAQKALDLFKLQNGLEGMTRHTRQSRPLRIFKDKALQPGKAFYPADLSKDELVDYLLRHPDEIQDILKDDTIVKRDGSRLKAVPFNTAFRKEYDEMAQELERAAQETDHAGLKKYLVLQAKAFRSRDGGQWQTDANAAWLEGMKDSPIEFFVTTSYYNDRLMGDVASDPRLQKILKERGIRNFPKNTLGARLGLRNPKADAMIKNYRKHLADFSRSLPLAEQYPALKPEQLDALSLADVDMIALSGNQIAMPSGAISAWNAKPNRDGKARIVFYRPCYMTYRAPEDLQKYLNALVEPSQRHWATSHGVFSELLGHELGHSLGPAESRDGRDRSVALGKYSNLLEESKADMVSLLMTKYLQDIGDLDTQQARNNYLSWAVMFLPNRRPDINEPHRIGDVLELNYFIQHDAIQVDATGMLRIIPEKFPEVSRKMLTEIIEMQLGGNPETVGRHQEPVSTQAREHGESGFGLRNLNARIIKVDG
jgi:hypothetical protein